MTAVGTHKLRASLTAIVLASSLFACGSSNNDASEQTNLRVTTLDDVGEGSPIAGLFVTLYAQDGQTIAQTRTTDANGIADFGSVAKGGKSTFTIINDLGATTEIATIVDVNNGEVFTRQSIDRCDEVATITGQFAGSAAETIVSLKPLSGARVQTGQPGASLAFMTQGLSTTDLPYAIGSADPDVQGTVSIGVAGVINTSVSYQLNETVRNESLTGSIKVMDQFAPDFYYVTGTANFAGSDSETKSCWAQQTYDALPASLQLDVPDYGAVQTRYDAANGTVRTTGFDPTAVNALQIALRFAAAKPIQWDITAPPRVGTFVLPDLPAPFDATVNSVAVDAKNSSTALSDYFAFSSYQQLMSRVDSRVRQYRL